MLIIIIIHWPKADLGKLFFVAAQTRAFYSQKNAFLGVLKNHIFLKQIFLIDFSDNWFSNLYSASDEKFFGTKFVEIETL